MDRRRWIEELGYRLGRRSLVYFGTRGADARTLTDLPQFQAIFSQIAPSGLAGVDETCLEALTGRRVDLDTYRIDADPSPAVSRLRQELLERFGSPAAVLPYRSTAVLAAAWFPRSDRVAYLGVFHEIQSCFEHKPWVETQLAQAGVCTVPWRYYTDDEREPIRERLVRQPLVVRANRSDGGSGVRLVQTADDLDVAWPGHTDGFLAAAPFLEGIPLNVNACAFADGSVSIHGGSLQLIGIPGCTTRQFGYCGNDFGALRALDRPALDQLDRATRQVGAWLATQGYRGAFGIDAILAGNQVYVIEVNARFQGSSRLAATLDAADGRPDLFLAHAGAYLELSAPDKATVADLAGTRPPRAHVVVHTPVAITMGPARAVCGGLEVDLLPEPGVHLDEGAIMADLVATRQVTANGWTLAREVTEAVVDLTGPATGAA